MQPEPQSAPLPRSGQATDAALWVGFRQFTRRLIRRPGLISLILLGIVAGFLLGTTLLVFSAIDAERVQRRQVERTNAILMAMQDIDTAALHGETAQRGYFITADKRYLEPYRFGHTEAPIALARLKDLLKGRATTRQRELLDEIGRLSDAKWVEMTDTISLVDQGRIVEAHARILSDEGQLAMVRLRAAIGELERIERDVLVDAAQRTATAEARVVPALLGLAGILFAALGLGLWQVVRTARIEEAAANAAAIAEARDRADLLAHELNHRVKNLFAVILAIVKMSGRSTPEAAPVLERISGRIHALVRAHDVSQGRSDTAGISLAALIQTAVAPYLSEDAQCDTLGPEIWLSERNTVPMGLILHELVTNAVKYGAWSTPGGIVQVRWHAEQRQPDRVVVNWIEKSTASVQAPEPGRNGFGSMLIESAMRQMSGAISREFAPNGMRVRLEFAAGSA